MTLLEGKTFHRSTNYLQKDTLINKKTSSSKHRRNGMKGLVFKKKVFLKTRQGYSSM